MEKIFTVYVTGLEGASTQLKRKAKFIFKNTELQNGHTGCPFLLTLD